MIERFRALSEVRGALARSPVVALVGPRQCGKTTLARQIVPPDSVNFFDLEDPASQARLAEPMTALSPLTGTVVIDEVQREPELFTLLRVLVDRPESTVRYLVLGTATPQLLKQSSESLAGRIEIVTLGGFSIDEVGTEDMNLLWRRGGFPRSYLANSDQDSLQWRRSFIQTFLERDIPSFGIRVPPTALLRFWTMLAHYHGGIWNASEHARSMGVTEPTARTYLDLLSGLFMVRQLLPWHVNLKKRQVKSPRVYIRDSGLLHVLLGIRSDVELLSHPKVGASWEGCVLEEILTLAQPDEFYFWATYQGAELDLYMLKDGRWCGVEVKRQDAPRITTSMRVALDDLSLDGITVLYPGDRRYDLSERIRVVPVAELASGNVDGVCAWPPD